MYSILAFAITLVQLCAVLVSLAVGATQLFSILAMYGSPFYLITHLDNVNPFSFGMDHIYFMLLSFHAFKYCIIARAYAIEQLGGGLLAAFVLEFAYLAISAYYIG